MIDTTLTIICNPAAPGGFEGLAPQLKEMLERKTANAVMQRRLSEGVAEEFAFRAARKAWPDIASSAHSILGQRPVDVAIQPSAGRARRLLIADMDSTIIEQECIDELADFVGKRVEISDITERAMRGELDFDGALRERVAMLKGLSVEKLGQAFRERITLTSGARTLVQTMRKRGACAALVSGGFTYFTERVADAAGFHVNQANTLEIENDALTGGVGEPILGRAAKETALRHFAEDQNIPLDQALAVGDGANDLDMLGAAGLGVAFRAKPTVAAQADIRIDHADLTALLYLQGIPQSEFSTD